MMTMCSSDSDLMPSDKPRVTIYLDEETKTDLEMLAKANDRPVSNLVLVLIKEAIAQAKTDGVIEEQSPSNERRDKL